jgi:hypothetical protein
LKDSILRIFTSANIPTLMQSPSVNKAAAPVAQRGAMWQHPGGRMTYTTISRAGTPEPERFFAANKTLAPEC